MSEHTITFEELADWLDGHLEPEARQRVEAHLAAGCPACQGELAWLRRFKEAGRVEGFVQPPPRLIAGAKASYRAHAARRRVRAWRLAPALGALLLVVALATYLVRTPTVFARGATVASADALQASPAEGVAWRALSPGDHLNEGERIQASGEATVTLFDGTTLAMQPGAQVALSSLRSGLFGVAREVTLYQSEGTVCYDVPSRPHALGALHVQSPTGTVAVLGTRFLVSVGADGETIVEVLAGTVTLSGAVDSATLAAGEAASIARGAVVRRRVRATPVATPAGESAPSATGAPPAGPGQPGPGGTETAVMAAPSPTASSGPGAPEVTRTPQPVHTPGGAEPGPTRTPGSGEGSGSGTGPGG